MNKKDRERKKNVKQNNKRLHLNIYSVAKLTSVVEDSEEVEGDVSVLLLRYFLFIARSSAFQLAQASRSLNACSNTHTQILANKKKWIDSMVTTLSFYISTNSLPNKKNATMRRNKLMRKKQKKKSRLSRAIDKKEKHVHCVSRKQQHASIVLKREMK